MEKQPICEAEQPSRPYTEFSIWKLQMILGKQLASVLPLEVMAAPKPAAEP